MKGGGKEGKREEEMIVVEIVIVVECRDGGTGGNAALSKFLSSLSFTWENIFIFPLKDQSSRIIFT